MQAAIASENFRDWERSVDSRTFPKVRPRPLLRSRTSSGACRSFTLRMKYKVGVGIVPTGLPALRVSPSGHHVVPPFEPQNPQARSHPSGRNRGIRALRLSTRRTCRSSNGNSARFFRLVRLDFIKVLTPLFQVFKLLLAKRVRTCRRWTEIGVNGLPSPGRLDDQDRFLESLLHIDSKGELRTDLVACFAGFLRNRNRRSAFRSLPPCCLPRP